MQHKQDIHVHAFPISTTLGIAKKGAPDFHVLHRLLIRSSFYFFIIFTMSHFFTVQVFPWVRYKS